jgi:hypothetical protein
LSRFIPIWPDPAPISPPKTMKNREIIENALTKLQSLDPCISSSRDFFPRKVLFTSGAKQAMYELKIELREIEKEVDGLLMSFCGKLSGLTARLSLILTYIAWASGSGDEPLEIEESQFNKARALVIDYILPMARRAYAIGSMPEVDAKAYNIISIIREHKWKEFSTRQLCRLNKAGLKKIDDINPSLRLLIEADIIKEGNIADSDKGGRPHRRYLVNPKIFS